ncbi:metallophosphoesterase family protein [Sphingomonas sp. CJ99]
MTRTAVLSDIHGNLPALEAVHADALAQGCTRFVNLGDSLSGPLWPAETADWLMAQDWATLAGNHERQLLTHGPERIGKSDRFTRERLLPEHLEWLRMLPATTMLNDTLLCHGSPRSDVEHLLHSVDPPTIRDGDAGEVALRLGPADAMLILCGHTHLQRIVTLADGRRVANAGSVGLQAYDDDHPAPYRVEVGDPDARYLILDGSAVSLRRVAYDHHRAAAKARIEGFEGWAHALSTGQMPPWVTVGSAG